MWLRGQINRKSAIPRTPRSLAPAGDLAPAGGGTANQSETSSAKSPKWSLGFPSSPFWKMLSGALVLVLLIFAGIKIYERYTGTAIPYNSTNFDVTSLVLAVIAAAMLVVAFMIGDKNEAKKLFTIVYISALLLFVIVQYKTGGLYVGYRREILYLLTIAAGILAFKYAVTDGEKKTYRTLVFVTFALLGLSHMFTWDQFKRIPADFVGGTKEVFVGQCYGGKKVLEFGTMPVQVNPNGACSTDIWFDGHCILMQRGTFTNDTRTYRSCGGTLPLDIEWVWSGDTPFDGAVQLHPPRYQR